MKTASVLLSATFAAITTIAAAAPATTDEARAEAAQRNTAAARAAALTASAPVATNEGRVTDTDSARITAARANERQTRNSLRAEALRAGPQAASIKVTDTDSARAAAAQQTRQQTLSAEYGKYQQM